MAISGTVHDPFSTEQREVLSRFVHRTFGHDRFTQDSPILPDVWLAFWKEIVAERTQASDAHRKHGRGDGPLIDVIMSPRDGVEPGKVAVALEWMLAGNSFASVESFRAERRLAYSRSAVFAKLTFKDILRGVIPLTAWWGSVFEGAKAQAQTKVQDAPDRDNLGGMFAGRVKRFTDEIRSGDTNPTIDAVVQQEEAQFQLYRFGALASLTWRSLYEREYSADHFVDNAEKLSARGTKLDVIRTLVVAFENVMAEVDGGTAARAMVKGLIQIGHPDGESMAERLDADQVLIHSVSTVRNGQVAVTRSRQAVKADAVQNVFSVDLRGIAWAVIDSGIDARHQAFTPSAGDEAARLKGTRIKATYDFTYIRYLMATGGLPPLKPSLAKWQPLQDKLNTTLKGTLQRVLRRRNAGDPLDWALLAPLIEVPHIAGQYRPPGNEHGTHVAGIIAADWAQAPTHTQTQSFNGLKGVCPGLSLYDLRVFDDEGKTDEDSIIHALEFVEFLNRRGPNQRLIHGVNISAAFGYRAISEACGHTQLCRSCNSLVDNGVVVVAAAGNFGFTGDRDLVSLNQNYRDCSITDPGNAEKVITVGSTHAEKPHSYGVSYFSSRGPTADGRMKPDLVAPGEKIISATPCIPGNPDGAENLSDGLKALDGTSMAAPHVSGVAALLMARHRELIGQPERVKEIMCRTATSLGRLPAFQGAGLVDALRALQSI